jgi:hypothetical protein
MRSYNKLLSAVVLTALFIFLIGTVPANGQSSKIYIIDPLVVSVTENPDGISPTDRIFNLPDAGNPLVLISNELKNQIYSEVHLFVLTKPGSMIFDELTILAGNVDDYSSFFAEWGESLTPGAKIVIHSQILTSDPAGLTLVHRISELTGAEVLVQ